MQNLIIPSQANLTPNDPIAPANTDASVNNSPEGEQFNKILAREITDKSGNTANKATAPTEASSTELNNDKVLPQTPEKAASVAQSILAKKIINFETDNNTSTLNMEELLGTESTLPIVPAIPSVLATPIVAAAPITPPIAAIDGSAGHTTNQPGQATNLPLLASDRSTQQNPTHYIPYVNDHTINGQQLQGAANSATANQILPSAADIRSTTLLNTEESAKFSATELTPSGTSLLSSTAPSTTSSSTLITQNISLDAQVGQPKWGGEFAEKIVWLTSQQQQAARISLNPAHLGPVEVMLSITQDQATAHFVSSHLAVREAIEASIPRLREMLAENGITLGDVNVGAESFQQQADTKQNNNESSGYNTDTDEINGESISQVGTSIAPSRHNGMVNTFA